MGERKSDAQVVLKRLALTRAELVRELQASRDAQERTCAELTRTRIEEDAIRQATMSNQGAPDDTIGVHLARASRAWLRDRARRLEQLGIRRHKLEQLQRGQLARLEHIQCRVEANLRGEETLEKRERADRIEREHFEEDQDEQSIRDRLAGSSSI